MNLDFNNQYHHRRLQSLIMKNKFNWCNSKKDSLFCLKVVKLNKLWFLIQLIKAVIRKQIIKLLLSKKASNAQRSRFRLRRAARSTCGPQRPAAVWVVFAAVLRRLQLRSTPRLTYSCLRNVHERVRSKLRRIDHSTPSCRSAFFAFMLKGTFCFTLT